MIPQRDLSWQTQSWQEQIMNAVTSSEELLGLLKLTTDEIALSEPATKVFPVFAPLSFVSRMQSGDPGDPLLRQVLNLKEEDYSPDNFVADPLDERSHNPTPGLIRKYKNRVLLIVTGKCAVHCRYCFRREFSYSENSPSKSDWQKAFDYLKDDPEIEEVILSGGDPLSAPDRHIAWMIEQLEQISSIRRLRIHTRLPVVLPSRITDDFLELLETTELSTTIVIHANHANEFNAEVNFATKRLKIAANFVLNQSVLLKGVNDDLSAQIQLQKACIDSGVLPYYLHFLDRVRGASHFEVSKADALDLYQQMQASLSGYMLPKLVIETSGATSKQFLR